MSHFELTSQKGFMNNLRWHQIVKSFLCRYISGRLLEQNISSQPYFRAQITEIKHKDIFYWNPQDIGRFLFLLRAFLWLLYHNSILSIMLIILRYHTMFYIIIPLNNILFRSGSHLVSRLTNQSFDCYLIIIPQNNVQRTPCSSSLLDLDLTLWAAWPNPKSIMLIHHPLCLSSLLELDHTLWAAWPNPKSMFICNWREVGTRGVNGLGIKIIFGIYLIWYLPMETDRHQIE